MSDSEAAHALSELLGGLCKTDDDRAILAALCEAVEEVGDEELVFEEGEAELEPAREPTYRDDVPRSFSDIARSVGALWWDGGGPMVGYGLLDDGLPEADDEGFAHLAQEDAETAARIRAAGGAVAAFGFGQNWSFFDPTRTLANGEKALAFVSHESVDWEEVTSVDALDYGQILLRLLSDAMLDTDHVPEMYA